MKIAFLTYNRDPSLPSIDSDGCPVTARNYALGLGARGHTVDVFVNRMDPTTAQGSYWKKKYRLQARRTVTVTDGVRVFRVPFRRVWREDADTLPDILSELPEITESLAGTSFYDGGVLKKYDVVCLFHPLAAFGPLFTGTVHAAKYIVFPMLLSDEYRKFQRVSDEYVALEAAALKKAGAVFAASAGERADVLAKGVAPKKVRVVRRGFDGGTFYHTSRGSRPSKGKTIKLICVGSIKPQKNLEFLVPVLQKLRSRGWEATVSVVGENNRFVKA